MTNKPAPLPAWDDLTDGEVLVAIYGTADELGRVRLDAFWRSNHGPGVVAFHNPHVGVRAQAFHTNLAGFVANEARQGHKVRGVDVESQALIDDVGPGS